MPFVSKKNWLHNAKFDNMNKWIKSLTRVIMHNRKLSLLFLHIIKNLQKFFYFSNLFLLLDIFLSGILHTNIFL